MHKKIHVKTKNKICAAVLVFVLAGSLTECVCKDRGRKEA